MFLFGKFANFQPAVIAFISTGPILSVVVSAFVLIFLDDSIFLYRYLLHVFTRLFTWSGKIEFNPDHFNQFLTDLIQKYS